MAIRTMGTCLKKPLRKLKHNSGKNIEIAFVDKGYRGHTVEGKTIFISGQRKGLNYWIKTQIKRRQAIEPHIGHMKNDGKLGRNYLKSRLGDCFKPILCGIGHNMRLIYNWLVAQNFPKRLYSGYKSSFSLLIALKPYLEGYPLLQNS
ncbi:hypothetical protein DB41_IB00170 [Neochlamydia sp. TUME1]|uniref:hypothetical protein n=1 Tax=Neochlamydia sp. TUME1 TaxID=1478174 RepID=UPI000583CB85|nr:hypothetical protein [Neochlamydia sp. TUME1]KIC74884.1 hypothetical protein DB41_IB00170 [Neochlamydia sp. TUME1]